MNSIFVKDVDSDGDLDVLSASQEDNKISWHENDGGSPPGWTDHVVSTAAAFAMTVYAADLDGDTDIDILSASFDDDTIAWYESDGGSPPTFTEHTITTGAWGARSVFAADLEGDGDMDVLSGTQRDHDIVWYVNDTNYLDTDGDGMRNDLDCAPNNAAALVVPGTVRNLRFATRAELTWASEAPRSGAGTVYDVLQGLLGQLPVGSGSEICKDDGTAETTHSADTEPASGTGFYYLVRGSNACGVRSWGFESSGTERTSTACP